MNANKPSGNIQMLLSAFLIFVGSGLLIAGFCINPTGEIDKTVLIAFGEILTFVGSVSGIDYTYKYKHLKVGITHHDKEEKNQ